MFEVLVYMFENYFEADIRPDQSTLSKELFAAGFDQADINGAFDWFSALEKMTESEMTEREMTQAGASAAGHGLGLRVYIEAESKKISSESLSFMMFLEQAKVLNPAQRELVIDRAMALTQPEVTIEEIRWIVLMALWNQGKGKANDYLFVEDAIFNESRPTLH